MSAESTNSRGRVGAWMHAGIVSCPSDASLNEVARVMSDHRVHAVAVADIEHGRPWGTWHIATDRDVVEAIAAGLDATARDVAGTDAATVLASDRIDDAARRMVERGVSHLVVLHETGGYPVGILSTLDVAAAYCRAS